MTTKVTGYLPSVLATGEAMGLPMPELFGDTPRWQSMNEAKCWEDNGLLRVASKDTWTRRNPHRMGECPMRTFEEADAAARDGSPFANGTEGEIWMANNCERCIHDKGTRDGSDPVGCPLVMVALIGKTPSEWMRQPERDYLCVEFRDEHEPDQEPKPLPVDPDQLELIPAEPYRGVRMFAQAAEEVIAR